MTLSTLIKALSLYEQVIDLHLTCIDIYPNLVYEKDLWNMFLTHLKSDEEWCLAHYYKSSNYYQLNIDNSRLVSSLETSKQIKLNRTKLS